MILGWSSPQGALPRAQGGEAQPGLQGKPTQASITRQTELTLFLAGVLVRTFLTRSRRSPRSPADGRAPHLVSLPQMAKEWKEHPSVSQPRSRVSSISKLTAVLVRVAEREEEVKSFARTRDRRLARGDCMRPKSIGSMACGLDFSFFRRVFGLAWRALDCSGENLATARSEDCA